MNPLAHTGRIARAITAVCQAAATAGRIPVDRIDPDDDFVDDLVFDELELESLALIAAEHFCIEIPPEDLFATPKYRTAQAFAEWIIARADEAAWRESRKA